MNAELKFHESTLAMIAEECGDVVVRLRPASVRQTEKNEVNGYTQNADLRFFQARLYSSPNQTPVWIAEGMLHAKGKPAFKAHVPMPFRSQEDVSFTGVTAKGEIFRIEARGFCIEPLGERCFVEKLA
ncbi:MAG: hypothetical protein ACHQ5A_06515 [Opitutales bacterium]